MSLDETTDWEAVFEDPKTGLISLIMQAQSPETLKQTAHVVIRKLHARKDDERNIEKFAAALDKIVPDNALANDLGLMRIGVKNLLRQIKKDRQRKAAEYRVSQYAEGGRDRRATRARPIRQKPFWRTRPTKRRVGAIVATALAIAAAVAIIVQNPTQSPLREAQGRAAVRWVQNFVEKHLPMTSLRLESVRIKGDSVIEMNIVVSKSRDAKLFNALRAKSQSARADVLNVVCPPPSSGVYYLLDRGWTLWVVFRGQNEKLTDGGCRYRRARSRLDSPQSEFRLAMAFLAAWGAAPPARFEQSVYYTRNDSSDRASLAVFGA